ncbi:DUF2018 family protein [uncultured Campylobacter sp.]|uniref:DUF2018 family protein n=1 Tax=uncultured Campylobacter sp. TaxID=218934 RepID=UPI0026333D9D|nr:DUF2018 family protein [uncultured Campylobacter sp.]
MDFFDEMLNKSPREKFIEIVQNAPSGAIEKAFDDFLSEHIAMFELLEKNGLSEDDLLNFKLEHSAKIDELKDDYFIGLTAKILGQE